MDRRTGIFLVVALIMLVVPASMIWKYERVLTGGTVHLFEVQPIDPRDPFRGEYVRLEFAAEDGPFLVPDGWQGGVLHAVLQVNAEGFTVIEQLARDVPEDMDFITIETEANWSNTEAGREIYAVEFPFDRYYLKEGGGPTVERLLAEGFAEPAQPLPSHAVVRVRDGNAVVQDLIVGGRSIHDWLQEQN